MLSEYNQQDAMFQFPAQWYYEQPVWLILIFAEHNQKDAKFLNLFISVRRSTCFRQFFRPSSGAQNYTYTVEETALAQSV